MTEINSNNHEKERDDIDFCKKLETVALGCHLEVHTKIRSVFKEHEIESYQCVEFILDTPLGKDSDIQEVKISYPFLFRLINSLPFIYRIKHDKSTNLFSVTTAAKTKETLKDLRKTIRTPSKLKGHSIAEGAYNAWIRNNPPDITRYKSREELLSPNMQEKIKGGDIDSRVISNDFLLSPWLLNGSISQESPFILLQIPIATEVSFFGYFLVAYQDNGSSENPLKDARPPEIPKSRDGIVKMKLETIVEAVVKDIVKKIYVPTLILFHVSIWEDKLNELTKDAITMNNISDWDELLGNIQTETTSLSTKLIKSKLKLNDESKEGIIAVFNDIKDSVTLYKEDGDGADIVKDDKVNSEIDKLKKKLESLGKLKKEGSDLSSQEKEEIKQFNVNILKLLFPQFLSRNQIVTEKLESQPPFKEWRDNGNGRKPNDLESAFGKVWEKRKSILDDAKTPYDNTKIKNFKDTLYFHKYNIASPGMIELIKKLIGGAEQMKLPDHDGGSLPAALVYGEAGSGKDTMARLIALFTKNYSNAEIETINMAALKPNALAIPLLLGIKIDNLKIDIDGMIGNQNPPKSDKSVIILDELNSLDHDLQGSLLRILENGEVRPLFGSKTKNVKYLIVGIVNEDPEIVSREKEFKELKAAEAFLGKVIGSFLYQNFYSAKKLRPDLMYRLKRGLYIRIPPLHERREDIPILFAANIKSALKNLSGEKELPFEIGMDVFERLIKEDIDWPGNIRQLEGVTRDIASKVYEKHKEEASTDEVEIDILTVEKVLKRNYLINNPVNDQD